MKRNKVCSGKTHKTRSKPMEIVAMGGNLAKIKKKNPTRASVRKRRKEPQKSIKKTNVNSDAIRNFQKKNELNYSSPGTHRPSGVTVLAARSLD